MSADVTIDMADSQLQLLLASTHAVTDLTVHLQWSKFPSVWIV